MRIHDIRPVRIAVICSLFLISCFRLSGQGWSFSFAQSAGGPFEPEGNYVTGLHEIPGTNYVWFISNMPDGYANYMFGCVAQPDGGHYGGNNNFGNEVPQFHHFSRKSLLLPDEALMVLEETMPQDTSYRSLYLTRFNPNGQAYPTNNYVLDWHKPVYGLSNARCFAQDLIPAADGGFIILGTLRTNAAPGNRNVLLAKTDANGALLWTQIYATPDDDSGVQVVPASDGGFFILKNLRPLPDPSKTEIHLVKVDNAGNQEWDASLSGSDPDIASDLISTQDGNLAITGARSTTDKNVVLMKVSMAGIVLWRQDYAMPGRSAEGRQILEDPNGDLVIAAHHRENGQQGQKILLLKTDPDGAPLWERLFGLANNVRESNILIKMADGGYLIGGATNSSNWRVSLLIKTDVNGIVKAGVIKGNVLHDINEDCANATPDTPLENWVVVAIRDSTKVFYGTTDSAGNYRIPCDTGNYVVRLIYPAAYWNACVQDVAVHLSYQDTVQVDYSVQASINCPYLIVEHSSSLVRPCDTTFFNVHYCNQGPITAPNASFSIQLDEVFTFLYADAPPSSQVGNILRFPLGDVPSGACADFQVAALVDCSAPMWHTACSEVHIFPDSVCLPLNPAWSGALIEVENSCEGDSVHFILKNTGPVNMPAALDYIIIEDAVLLMQGEFQLQSLEEQDIALPANGATYHMLAQQEPFAPGSSLQISFVEACNTNPSGGSGGFVNQFPQNDSDPFVSIYCPVVQTSYDPNDKQAMPSGFGPEHNIFANTDLEYTIRFQNTGNDTAFRVVLLDTLSRFLDPGSIVAGASSHPYEYELEGNGVLRFTFHNILLPDSTTNPDASQGFVTFRIRQQRNNPVGTVIENNADIYFDFNKPVRTNTVFHKIHESLFDVVSTTTVDPEIKMDVETHPNPFSEQLRIKLSGTTQPNTTLQLYNMTGQLVRSLELNENQALLQREGLDAGLYFFTVLSGQKLLGTGKVVVK